MSASASQIAGFTSTYAPYATAAGASLGISPSTVLAQWAYESNYGTTQAAQSGYNLAGIMLPGGTTQASYASPSAFEQAYVNTIAGNFPGAENSGANLTAFVNGLTNPSGQIYYGTGISSGGYFSGLAATLGNLFNYGVSPSSVAAVQTGQTGNAGVTGTTTPSAASTGSCGPLTGLFTWSCWQNIITDLAFVGIGVMIFIVAVASGLFSGGTPSHRHAS